MYSTFFISYLLDISVMDLSVHIRNTYIIMYSNYQYLSKSDIGCGTQSSKVGDLTGYVCTNTKLHMKMRI